MSECKFSIIPNLHPQENFSCIHPSVRKIVNKDICSTCSYFMQHNDKPFSFRNGEAFLLSAPDPPKKESPCTSCKEVKRVKNTDGHTQFVWPYWHGGAIGDEIRFSVRSVETFFEGKTTCTIIGDKPPWFFGHYIPQKRVSRNTPNRPFRDMLSKVKTMAEHKEISDNFIWMMDDIYLIKPCSLDDLKVPRAIEWKKSEKNSWQRRKTFTMKALESLGRTTYDYATHLPHWVEKNKLFQIFQEFNLDENTMLWEILYCNTFREEPKKTYPFFKRISQNYTTEQIIKLTKEATIFNHTSNCWSKPVRQFLLELLPKETTSENFLQFEAESNSQKSFKKNRNVKRRPPETHRRHIER